MDQIAPLKTFMLVAELRSFALAAKRLGLARSTISAQIQSLEQQLGVALLNRTTRRVSLTADGERFLDRAGDILDQLAALESEFRAQSHRAAGHLNVEMSESIANLLVIPRLAEFVSAHPDVSLRIFLSERTVDLVAEGIDLALTLSHLDDSPYRYRKYAQANFVLVASPAYLARHGAPRHPDDLARHRAIGFFNDVTGRPWDWIMAKGGEELSITPPDGLTVNNTKAGLTCALAGLGIFQEAEFLVARPLAEGRLVRVLPDWKRLGPYIAALYRPQQPTPPHLRAFIDFLDRIFKPAQALPVRGNGGAPRKRAG